MKPAALFLGLILAVAGCAQFGLQETALSTPIAPSEVDWARAQRHQHGERNRAHEGRRHEP